MSLININRFFKEVLPHIGNKEKIIEELVENAHRAHASFVNLTIGHDFIESNNNGEDIKDWVSLLCVGDSNYDADVLVKQNPAGMGLMMLMSVSNKAIFTNNGVQLKVDCEKFFSDEKYRAKLHNKLLTPHNLPTIKNCPAGVTMRFSVDPEFAASIKNTYLSVSPNHTVNCQINRLRYYGIKIFINNTVVKPKSIKWLVSSKLNKKFEFSTIGIPKHDDEQGIVIWHGKKISCPEISPFSIVINSEFNDFKPQLPDRERIDLKPGEAEALNKRLESELKAHIQKVIDKVDTSINENSDDFVSFETAYWLLSNLTERYDIDHFKQWKCDSQTFVDGGFSMLVSNNYNCKINNESVDDDFGFDLVSIEAIEGAEVFKGVSNKVGNTPAPAWVLDSLVEDLEITHLKHPFDDALIGLNYSYHMIKDVKANGLPVNIVYFDSDYTVCFSCPYQIEHSASDISFSLECSYDEIVGDAYKIMEQINNGIDLRAIIASVRCRVGNIDIKSINVDIDKKQFHAFTADGKKHNLELRV